MHAGCTCAYLLEECALHCVLGEKKPPIGCLSGTKHARPWQLASCTCQLQHRKTFKFAYSKIPWELVKYFYIGGSGMKRRFGMVFTDFVHFQYLHKKIADLCFRMPDFRSFGARANAPVFCILRKPNVRFLWDLVFESFLWC